MIVDDERPLVDLTEEMLAQLGYEPIGFESSAAALRAFQAQPHRFDIILTDEAMPDLTGTDLAREIRHLRPEVPILLMSGYGGSQLDIRASRSGVTEVLRKPLQKRELSAALARSLEFAHVPP
jgi:DNA-binding NtrC family response regulator